MLLRLIKTHDRMARFDRPLHLRRDRGARMQIVLGQIDIDAQCLDLPLDERDMLQVMSGMAEKHFDSRRQGARGRPCDGGPGDGRTVGGRDIGHERMIGTSVDRPVTPALVDLLSERLAA